MASSASAGSPNSAGAGADASGGSATGKPRRQVTKFRDDYGVVLPFCRRYEFEYRNIKFDPKDYCYGGVEEEDTNHVADPQETLIRYVNQIRKSFGFDVDCVPPSWFDDGFGCIFTPVKDMSNDPFLHNYVDRVVEYTVAEISVETETKYELVKVEKLVVGHCCMLFPTLRVKDVGSDGEEKIIQAIAWQSVERKYELFQWRYKPDEDDDWITLPPIPSDSNSPNVDV